MNGSHVALGALVLIAFHTALYAGCLLCALKDTMHLLSTSPIEVANTPHNKGKHDNWLASLPISALLQAFKIRQLRRCSRFLPPTSCLPDTLYGNTNHLKMGRKPRLRPTLSQFSARSMIDSSLAEIVLSVVVNSRIRPAMGTS